MSQLPFEASSLARCQHGLITSEQLADRGVSAFRRRRLVAAGTLQIIHQGVLRYTAVADSLEQRCLAACLAVPDVAISGPTAGRLLKLRRMPSGPVHAMIRLRTVELDGVIVHRTNQLDPEQDMTTREDGIRLLSPTRLVFDLSRFLDDDDLESVMEQVLERQIASVPDLFATARRLRRVGRMGSARFGRVLGRRPLWTKPLNSDYEVRLLRALRQRGVDLAPQLPVELPEGTLVHLDGGDRERRFGVEVDHVTWHGGRLVSEYDKWRDRQLARIGWVVPRVPDTEIDHNLACTVSELVEIYDGRATA